MDHSEQLKEKSVPPNQPLVFYQPNTSYSGMLLFAPSFFFFFSKEMD